LDQVVQQARYDQILYSLLLLAIDEDIEHILQLPEIDDVDDEQIEIILLELVISDEMVQLELVPHLVGDDDEQLDDE
jgi:hypothetical protein